MKSKIFKIVLPAFALVFAITASLAFTPAENSMVEDTPITSAYFQNPDEFNCTHVNQVDCDTVGTEICTILGGPSDGIQLFKKNTQNACNIVLFRPVQP